VKDFALPRANPHFLARSWRNTRNYRAFGWHRRCNEVGIGGAVAPTHIDLHVYDATGRQHLVQAFLADRGDWSVRASINGHVFARECDSWQSVERSLFWFRLHADQTQPPAPRAATPVAAALGALMILCAAVAASAQSQMPDSDAIRQFTTATQEYAWLHRRLENQLPPLEVNSNPDTINRVVQEMAAAVRAARPHARQGDLFTDTLGAELRLRIAGARSPGSTRARCSRACRTRCRRSRRSCNTAWSGARWC
jgi:hypothetical protein